MVAPSDKQALWDRARRDLQLAQGHLAFSLAKVQRLRLLATGAWSEEDLEVLEAFASRFSRAADLVVARALRLCALRADPAFRGTVVDLLNHAERHGLIESAATWYRIRELRNVAAHEYLAEDLLALYRELARLAPTVLEVLRDAP